MNTTAIDILDKMIEELENEKPEIGDYGYEEHAIRCLKRAKHDILALPKSDDELIDFALWYHRDLTDSQRESNTWDLISFFRSLPPTQLPQ